MSKRLFVFMSLCVFMVACATQKYAANDRHPARDLASFSAFQPTSGQQNGLVQKAAATVVGPKGDVIFFIKVNDKVIIKECEPYSVVQKKEDCEPRAGTQVRSVPADQFKSHLKNALLFQSFKFSDSGEKSKVDAYKEAIHTQDPGINLDQLRKEKQKIEGFIQFYCGSVQSDSDCATQNADVVRLKAITKTLNAKKGSEQAVADINQIIDKLVDDVIGSETVTPYKFSDASGTIAYQVLRSYVRPYPAEMSFVTARAGSFTMGSPSTEQGRYGDDENQVPVKITKDFDMQSTVITQLQWWAIMGTNPSYFSKQQNCPNTYLEQEGVGMCSDFPVEQVSWNEVQDFITKLNSQDSKFSYRLPTEAEWEFAARAGRQTAYSFGDDVSQLGDYAWYSDNSNSQSHAVATKKANPWGLYDVHGNVWEWVQDWYGSNRPSSLQTDPTGPSSGSYRVVRGGGWSGGARFLRSAFRFFGVPGYRYGYLGARLVRTAK